MRILLAGVASLWLVGCGPSGGTVSLVLDIPNATLDPKGYTSVEIRLHDAEGSRELNVAVRDGAFDLGAIDVTRGVMIEAALRTDSGTAVGYGRTAAPADLRDGQRIVIPVRRPIVYFAGLIYFDTDGNPSTTSDWQWVKSRPTFSDLSAGTFLDGSTKLAENAVMTVTAGPQLYVIDQSPSNPTGALVGTPVVKSVSTGDHSIGSALPAMLDGGVVDAAGSDDGRLLLVATTTHLFLVDTTTGMARPIADGNFARVAIVSAVDGTLTAVAVKNRSPGACSAELVWVAVNADDTNQAMTLGTSGYTDVAGTNGRAFYVDSCKGGELGEATAAGTQPLRGELGTPSALAVSSGQAWIGIERPSSGTTAAGMALISVPLVGDEPPRTLFDEIATQVVEARNYPGVQRELRGRSVSFLQLEVGVGGDFVAVTLDARYDGPAIREANFPRMEIESQELRVIDTVTGAFVQRYRSWCDGVLYIGFGDIPGWGCAISRDQMAPTDIQLEHRISSMTILYGQK